MQMTIHVSRAKSELLWSSAANRSQNPTLVGSNPGRNKSLPLPTLPTGGCGGGGGGGRGIGGLSQKHPTHGHKWRFGRSGSRVRNEN